jgi:hypothetical protein
MKQNIKYGFKTTCIWPLNPKAMDNKIRPLKVYTTTNMNNAGSKEDYTTKEETKNNLQWGEEFDGVEFLHITEKD